MKEEPKQHLIDMKNHKDSLWEDEPKQETLEEAAEDYGNSIGNNDGTAQFDFIKGAKWQQERGYSDMQEYAEFCIECDRKQMPLLLVQDWYEHYKK